MYVQTDDYPDELSYSIWVNEVLKISGDGKRLFTRAMLETECIYVNPEDCVKITVTDEFGDGFYDFT